MSSKALLSENLIWISSTDATINTDHVLLLLSLIQREDIHVSMVALECWPRQGRWKVNSLSCAVDLSSEQFCSVSRTENIISFHSFLQHPSFSLNILWLPHHHVPVSLWDVSWGTGIYHWQMRREKCSGAEEDYSKPSSGFPGWQDRWISQLLHCFLYGSPWSAPPVPHRAPNKFWNCPFPCSAALLLCTMLAVALWEKQVCAFCVLSTLDYPPGSRGQNHGAGTMCHMRISLASWISDTLQQSKKCLFPFPAVLPSTLSIHSPQRAGDLRISLPLTRQKGPSSFADLFF